VLTLVVLWYAGSALWGIPEVRDIAVALVRGERPDMTVAVDRFRSWAGLPPGDSNQSASEPQRAAGRGQRGSGAAPEPAGRSRFERGTGAAKEELALQISRYGGRVYQLGDPGLSAPRIQRRVDAEYPAAARQRRIQGVVALRCLLEPDGTISTALVTGSLDTEFGLDDEALKAVRQWRFDPARVDGKPVAVVIVVTVPFPPR
jgi:protein TonB